MLIKSPIHVDVSIRDILLNFCLPVYRMKPSLVLHAFSVLLRQSGQSAATKSCKEFLGITLALTAMASA